MRIILFSENGSLSKQFSLFFKSKKIKFYNVSRKNFNFNGNYKILKKKIDKFKPDFLINCIAMTGMAQCELNPKKAHNANFVIPKKILNCIRNRNIKFIHFSSESVFHGKIYKKIYSERDVPKPKTAYGISKLKADNFVKNSQNGFVFRLPLLFGPSHKNQIVQSLLNKIYKGQKIFVSNDIYSTPIYSPNLCEFIYKNFLKKNSFQNKLVHFSSGKRISLYELILNLVENRFKEKVIPISHLSFEKNKRLQPKNLGLKSIYSNKIIKLNYKKIRNHLRI